MGFDPTLGTTALIAGHPTMAAASELGHQRAGATIVQQRLHRIAAMRYQAGAQPPRCYFWVQTQGKVRSECSS